MRGLSAEELARAVRELRETVVGATVLDVAPLGEHDDLLVVLRPDGAGDTAPYKRFLHVALGSKRARVTLTQRRFGREQQKTGPQTDALKTALVNRVLDAIEHEAGERRCAFVFAGDEQLILHVELFSARGLWALCDETGAIRELSRPVQTAVRTLRPGDVYAPPPPGPLRVAPDEPRFEALAAIDAHFTELDQSADSDRLRATWQRAAERGLQKCERKIQGLLRQLAESERVPELRSEADLMLAYAHTAARGAASMSVPDPEDQDKQRTIALDPSKPVHVQAQARYERARRLLDGRAITDKRLLETKEVERTLREAHELVHLERPLTEEEQQRVVRVLQAQGVLPRTGKKTDKQPARKPDRRLLGLNLRQFTSSEGYELLIGRSNAQNDKLTMRIARGNDVWLHVGGGRAGSHVVIRLPKGKTASLETLLDAATLAVHFSKARGERTVDVMYTSAKHVRKPKGLPAGAVVPQQTKTVTVRLEEERLRRLLATAPERE